MGSFVGRLDLHVGLLFFIKFMNSCIVEASRELSSTSQCFIPVPQPGGARDRAQHRPVHRPVLHHEGGQEFFSSGLVLQKPSAQLLPHIALGLLARPLLHYLDAQSAFP